jgi:predicted DCC family thiol-disulfide oxidoreductase YuxK
VGRASVPARQLVLYDGVCGLCNKAVQWLLDHDPEAKLTYAPLQGETAAELRKGHPEIPDHLATIVFVEGERVSLYSDAVVQIARHLPAPWRWGAIFRWVPRPIRDFFYGVMAGNRYRIFGQYDTCRIPAPDQAARFLP